MIHLNVSGATRWGLGGLILLGLAVALYLGRSILIPTVIALLLAAMLGPSVLWLNRTGVPLPGLGARRRFPWLVPCVWRLRVAWSLACSCAVLLLVGVVLGIAVAFSAAIPKLLQTLPNDERKAQEFYARFRDRVQRVSPVPLDPRYFPESADDSEAVKYIRNALDPKNPQFIVTALLNVAAVGGSWLWQSILIMFLLLFLLLEGRMLTRRLVEVFGPSAEAQAKAVEALKDMANQVRTYLVWRTIINFALAIFLGAVYQVLGLSQAWTWALVTAILWYVPYLGPILAGVPPALDAFVTCDSPWAAIGVVLFYTVFVTVEGYFIVPVVMGRSMELNATTVMLACLFWELVWGWAGLFLAMPLMAAAKTICAHVPEWRPFANLMDTRDGPTPGPPEAPGVPEEELLGDTQVLVPEEMEEFARQAGPGGQGV